MTTIVFGPNWFFGIDSIFEIVSVLVAFLVAGYGRKAYRVTSDSKYRSISFAFLMIGIGMLIKIITNVALYASVDDLTNPAHLAFIYDVGYFLSRYLYIMGLMLISIALVLKIRDNRVVYIIGLLIAAFILLSEYSFYVYHGLAICMLALIIPYYWKNWKHRKTTPCRCVLSSFIFILLAHLFFMLVTESNRTPYAIAEGLQLFGFLSIAATYIMIMKRR